jgi:hypothetical protein
MWGFIGAYTLAPRGMTVSRRNHVLSEPSLSYVLVSPSVSVPEARVSPNALRRRAPTWWAERPQGTERKREKDDKKKKARRTVDFALHLAAADLLLIYSLNWTNPYVVHATRGFMMHPVKVNSIMVST